MASKGKKPAAAAPAAPATSVNLAILGAIVAATAAGSYLHVSDAEAAPMLTAGLVEVNGDIANEQGKATRATAKGIEHMQTNQGAATAAATPAATAEKPKFAIVSNVPVPESVRKGVTRTEQYPFSQLEAGQSFFIAATTEKPNPERSYASTVASARNRYATNHPTETRINKRTKATVPAKVFGRDFAIRAMADGAPYGQAGVKGAAVFRTK